MRTKNSIFNFITSIVPFALFVVLGFVRVGVWQDKMDENIYALNQLFFQLFAYLSIAEAGIGALIQKKYYELLVHKDQDTICQYYTLSKRMLRKVCYIIFGGGLVLSFFLPYLAKGNTLSLRYMQLVFLLFLVKSLVEYFMFSPRFLLTADQKLYKMNLQNYGYKIAESLLEILLIYVGVSYILVLCMSILLRIVMNLHLNRIVFREYPWLKEQQPGEAVQLKGMSHILIYKVVSAVHENAGALLISAFINPISVIIYTNYKYITKYLTDFIYQVGVAVTASLGNLLNAEESDQKAYDTFEMINTMFYFIATFLTLALALCINPFISVWVGADKLLDEISLLAILFVFFHNIARRPLFVLKDVCVLYKELQPISILEAVLTIGFSLLAIYLDMGIRGIVLAAAVALLISNFIPFPIIVYKKVFHRFPWLDFKKYFLNVLLVGGLYALARLLPVSVSAAGFLPWFLTSCVAALALLAVLFVCNWCLFKSFRLLVKTGLGTLQSMIKKS